ncbi:MAG: TRAP transporter small permease subunit [Sandaracinus sp.]|nr:TRAP transporter small permease subunit [Sandaracinus sp.]MCB9631049.1 TRAP transporter small permease subunit [Sandaracinus sp.]
MAGVNVGAGAPPKPRYEGPFAPLRKLDDVVFSAEQAIVAIFLSAMTVMVFLDVVYRRLVAPDSKIGAILAGIFGVDDPEGRARLDANVAPWVGGAIGFLAIWFGVWGARRSKRADAGEKGFDVRSLVYAVVGTVVVGVFLWLMGAQTRSINDVGIEQLEPVVSSRDIYLGLYAAGALAFVAHALRAKPEGWVKRLIGVGLATPLYVIVAIEYFPRGYSWSKELSLVLLLWVGFLGTSVCAHEGKHIKLEALGKLVPPHLARFVHAGGFLLTATFCAGMAYLGWIYVFDPEIGARAMGGTFEQTAMPDWIATIAVPIAFGLAMLRFVGGAVSALMGGSYGAAREDEVAAAKAAREAAGEPKAAEPAEPKPSDAKRAAEDAASQTDAESDAESDAETDSSDEEADR